MKSSRALPLYILYIHVSPRQCIRIHLLCSCPWLRPVLHMPLRLKHWRYRLVTCSCKQARILLRTLSPQQSMIIIKLHCIWWHLLGWSSKAFISALSKISKCLSALNFWWQHMHMCCKADIGCHLQVASVFIVGNLICRAVL